MRWFLVVAVVICAGCSVKPSCPPGDVGCLFSSLSVSASQSGAKLALTSVEAGRLGALDGGALALSGPPSLEIDPGGEPLVLQFNDPFGCQPAYCFSACPRGEPCASAGRCTPAVKDGLRSGMTEHFLEL